MIFALEKRLIYYEFKSFDSIISKIKVAKTKIVIITNYFIIIKNAIKNDSLINRRKMSLFKITIFIISPISHQIVIFMKIIFFIKKSIFYQTITFIKTIFFIKKLISR